MGWAQDWIFFSGNVQTTTIAIAITSSICCSIIWLVVNLMSGGESSKKPQRGSHGNANGRGCPMVSFHLRRSMSCVPRQSGLKHLTRSISHGTNMLRSSEKSVKVSCIRCGKRNADKECNYNLCTICCSQTPIDCQFHQSKKRHGLNSLSDIRPYVLNLSYLHLTQCPGRIGYIGTHLICLNLSGNKLTALPEEIGLLLGLEELCLQFNKIEELPESIGNLTKLVDLDMRCNDIKEIPDSFGSLQKLKYLNMMENSLSSIPSCIGMLIEMEEINLQNNQIDKLPDSLCHLINLQCLCLADNKLTCLPEKIGSLVCLTEIDVSNNQLVSLPHQICTCTSLVKLWLTDNRLSSLPAQIGRLHRLTELYLGNNKLRFLPASIVHLCLNLLIVMGNPLIKEGEHLAHSHLYNHTPPSDILSLLETSARSLMKSGIRWMEENLPKSLYGYLAHCQHCDNCGEPVFDHFTSKLTFHASRVIGYRIPLCHIICSDRHCSFDE